MRAVTGFWLCCLVAVSGISSEAVLAQSRSSTGSRSLTVGDVPVADVLRQLGAKLERGIASRTLDDHSRQFDRADSNRDGKHTRQEYVERGRYLTARARSGIFRAADGDGDGVVTRAEYILNRIITDEAKSIVQGMDDDGDGQVERAEFVKHSAKLLSGHKLAVQVFSALDPNADGVILIPEYLRVWGKWARAGHKSAEKRIASRRAELVDTPGREPARSGKGRPDNGPPARRPGPRSGRPSVDEVFARFDGNKDGKLQEEEIPEFVRRFILPADADGDGVVTREELQESRQRPGGRSFGGSPRQPNRRGQPERTTGDGPGSRGERPGGQNGRSGSGPQSPSQFVEHALRFDADKDGKLDRRELMKLAEDMDRRRSGRGSSGRRRRFGGRDSGRRPQRPAPEGVETKRIEGGGN